MQIYNNVILRKWDTSLNSELGPSLKKISSKLLFSVTNNSYKCSRHTKIVSFPFDFISDQIINEQNLKWTAISKWNTLGDYRALCTSFWYSHWQFSVSFVNKVHLEKFFIRLEFSCWMCNCVDLICHSLKWLLMHLINSSNM